MNVTSEIKSYIELKETCGALLLTGKWGCGKSYIMHQLADSLNGEDQYINWQSVNLTGMDWLNSNRMNVRIRVLIFNLNAHRININDFQDIEVLQY